MQRAPRQTWLSCYLLDFGTHREPLYYHNRLTVVEADCNSQAIIRLCANIQAAGRPYTLILPEAR